MVILPKNNKTYDSYIPGSFSEKEAYASHWKYLDEEIIPLPYISTSISLKLISSSLLNNLNPDELSSQVKSITTKLDNFSQALKKPGFRALSFDINGVHVCFIGNGVNNLSESISEQLYFYHELEHCYVRSQPNGYTLNYYWEENNPLLKENIRKELPSMVDEFNQFAKIYTRFIDESFADVASLIYQYSITKDISIFDDMANYRQESLCKKMDYRHWSSMYIYEAKRQILNGDLKSIYYNNHRVMAYDIVTVNKHGILTPVEYYQLLLNLKKKSKKITDFC